ncbi:hypothetical protein C5706_32960, partial [Klebsiella pneumoniae]
LEHHRVRANLDYHGCRAGAGYRHHDRLAPRGDQRLLKKLKTDMLEHHRVRANLDYHGCRAGAGYRHHDRLAPRGD